MTVQEDTMTITATPETTAAPAAVATFNAHPAHLDRALRIAQLAASKDATLPILNAVALTVTDNGNLVAQATDRYMLARAAVTLNTDNITDLDGLVAEPAIIPVSALAPLYAWLKPHTKAFHSYSFKVQVIDMPFPAGSRQLILTEPMGNTTHTVVLLDGDYPKIASLLHPWAAQDNAVDRFAVNPDKLLAVTKMGKLGCARNTSMEVCVGTGYNKPVRFRGRSEGKLTFEALVMPVSGGVVNDQMEQADDL